MRKSIVMFATIIALGLASIKAAELNQYGFSLLLSVVSFVPLFVMAHLLDKKR